jgi:hypothetical protein
MKKREVALYGWGAPREETAYKHFLEMYARLGIDLIVSHGRTNENTAKDIAPQLKAAHEAGVNCWLAIGVFHRKDGIDDEQLATDESTMSSFLEIMKESVRVYSELYPGGKVILWHEDPMFANWRGDTYLERVQSMPEYGPQIFAAQRQAVKEIDPEASVGIFLHHPQTASSEFSTYTVFENILDSLRKLDALPDFVHIDMYRGYYEVRSGPDVTNSYIRDLIWNAKRHAGDVPVYYLPESHTIKIGYTPSRKAIRDNVRAALEAGADGIGWYIGVHNETVCGFDSFLPVHDDHKSKEINMFTRSLDRYWYGFLTSVEMTREFNQDEYFDLWLYGTDFGYYDYEVSLRTTDGAWERIGALGGYHPDSSIGQARRGTGECSLFRMLRRDRYFSMRIAEDKEPYLHVRLEPAGGRSAKATVHAVYCMPYFESAVFKTEAEAAALLASQPADARIYSIANTVYPSPLQLGKKPVELRVQQQLDANFGILKQDLEKG